MAIRVLVLIMLLWPFRLCADDDARAEITWLIPDVPPAYLSNGPFARQGIGDLSLAVLMEALPEYRHQLRRVSLNTFVVLMRDPQENLCAPLVPAMARFEGRMGFSEPVAAMAPLRLITLRKHIRALPAQGDAVSLARLLETPLRTVRLAGWSNGDLQGLLDAARGQDNLLELSENATPENALELLMAGELDYLLGHGYLFHFARARHPVLADDLVLLPVAEAAMNTPLHVMCRDNAWGRQRLARINDLLRQPAVADALGRAQHHWYPAMDLSTALVH